MILIVDDNQENLYSLKTLLQLNAYDVDLASSGEEALKKVLKNDYTLIILDVQMPGMDGYEVAEAITGFSKTKNIPILFLSAVNIDKRFVTKGYISGGVDYVIKPFDTDLLLLKVKSFQKLYEQTRELKLIGDSLKEEVEIRKKAEEALQQMNKSLEEKVTERTKELLVKNKELEINNIELQQFASVASHDLQEPLRKIITFSNILVEGYLPDNSDAKMYMNKIVASSTRMRNLIDDLLNYSKLSVDSFFLNTNLNDILQETLTDLELPIKEKNAVIKSCKLPEAQVITGQVRQVFQNIISNALKFSKKDVAPVIKIDCELIEKNNADFICISIRDNGIGFEQIYADRIFTLFQRLQGKSQYEGTGIGLAIVKKIIEKHNGTISAESKLGEGSIFKITLPVTQSNDN